MAGKHDWNSYENYCEVHDSILNTRRHPFIRDHDVTITLQRAAPSSPPFVIVKGEIVCEHDVILRVEKHCEVRTFGRAHQLQVRVRSFTYNAHIRGAHDILRYDDYGTHDYHVHRWDLRTGAVIDDHVRIGRGQMPHLSEVLDELQAMFG